MFHKATKQSARLRMALIGTAGSGKTFTALSIAQHLGGPVAVIDTERGSASKYADLFEFDVVELESFSPKTYVEAIQAAEEAGYKVLVIDSLSHAWMGKDGALEQVDRASKRSSGGSGNSFGAWREVTPMHNALVDAMIGSSLHIIGTMRTKTEYVQEKDDRGKTVVRKVGMQPVQRDGLEYEFDVIGDLTVDNDLIIGKTRCPALQGQVFNKAGKEVADVLTAWLSGPSAKPVDRVKAITTIRALWAIERESGADLEEHNEEQAWPLEDYSDEGLKNLYRKVKARVDAVPAQQREMQEA